MTKFPSTLAIFVALILVTLPTAAQEAPALEVQALSQLVPGLPEGRLEFNPTTAQWTGTNGVLVRYGTTVLTANAASVNSKTGDVTADGQVRIESGEQVWVGDHIIYNFRTRQMQTEQFRTGKAPVFAGATGLTGNSSNQTYSAQNAFVTTDDVADPAYRVKAKRIKIVPGKYVEMWNAVLWAEKVPVFYFPYYWRNLGPRSSNFDFTPGFRSSYGGFLLGSYTWFLNDAVDGKLHFDYRAKRGPGLGPDLNLHLGRWGEAEISYYYLHDRVSELGTNYLPQFGVPPENRQRFRLGWQATPDTNLNLKALINFQTDPLVLRDFFPGQYDKNPQPNTFLEAQKYWDNWSLSALATPRVNSFFNQVERLPDVKLTGYRQQILDTPLYYDSESSLGWFRSYIANTNGDYFAANGLYTNAAFRADSYHQITLPWIFFDWLNVTPRAGGRFTFYNRRSYASGDNEDVYRGVFNTGMEVSFKASALWADAKNSFFDVDGLRHIIEPSANYVFVPNAGSSPGLLPQLDGEGQALLISPLLFPDYNSIDSIDSMNVIRFGLRNVLQTKRDGSLDNLVNWNVMLDWRLDPRPGQSRLNDLYSQFTLRPRTWLSLESQTRFDTEHGRLNLSFHQATFAPNDRWSWGVGHLYLRPAAWGGGEWSETDYLTSTAFYRLNHDWGFRAQHNFNIKTGRLQQQYYSVYRDLRSWTAALTFRVQDDINRNPDYTVAFQISLKAQPLRSVGEDVANPYRLVGE